MNSEKSKSAGRNQREFFRINRDKQIVQGYFYHDGTRFLKKICGFDEAGLDDEGKLRRNTKAAERRYLQVVKRRYDEIELGLREAKQEPPGKAISTVFEEWVRVSRAVKAKRTVEVIYFSMIDKYMKIVGDHDVRQLDLRKLDTFKSGLRESGLAFSTANMQLKSLKVFCNWAKKRGHIESLPEFEMFPNLVKVRDVYTDDEVRKLFERLKKLRRESKDNRQGIYYRAHERFVYLVVGTGFRLSEALYLEWSQCDLEQMEIVVRSKECFTVKEKRDKIRPILPFAVEYLKVEREKTPSERYILDDGYGNPLYPEPHAMSTAMLRHQKRAGLNPNVKCVHGLRALFASLAEDCRIDASVIRDLMGHSDEKVTQLYLFRPDSKMKHAVQEIQKRIERIGIL